jgi:thiopurine S-methyltransferase
LRSQGHEIVGIELSQIACESFFFEHALSFEKFNHGDCILYQSDGISIWCGDFFRVPPLAWKDCTFVYDRAGMVALPEDLRILYTQHLIRNFVGDNKQILLIAVEYQQGKVAGPPFSVMESEVKDRFQSNFMITKLETNSDNSLSDRADKFGAIEVNETVYWLVQK